MHRSPSWPLLLDDVMQEHSGHDCRFVPSLQWRPWRDAGHRRERDGVSVQCCRHCGAQRSARRPLRTVRVEVEAAVEQPPPLREENAIAVSRLLLRKSRGSDRVTGRGILGSAAGSMPTSLIEPWLERFLDAGWVRLDFKTEGSRRSLYAVYIRNPAALEEFTEPGRLTAYAVALRDAQQRVAACEHPVALVIAERLSGERTGRMSLSLIRALAALAEHVERGEVLAEKVFASRYLESSKALTPLRQRIERFLGPLDALGIREGAAITLVGGRGKIFIRGQVLDLEHLEPFIGLARDQLTGDFRVLFPSAGLFIIENLTVFEACCRGEVAAANSSLIVWSAGYPGRAVRRLIAEAVAARARIRAWADLDLDGIRIVRLLASWAGSSNQLEPYRMSESDVRLAPANRPLTRRARVQIQADLAAQTNALLAPTLRAIIAADRWVEQECFLGPPVHQSASEWHIHNVPNSTEEHLGD